MFKGFTEEDKDDPVKVLALTEKRDRAVEIFQKLAIKDLNNASISVKRQVSCPRIRFRSHLIFQAFMTFINVYILFSSKSQNALPAAQACPLVMPSEIQNKLGGAFQAAVERYASERAMDEDQEEDEEQVDKDGKLDCPWPKVELTE